MKLTTTLSPRIRIPINRFDYNLFPKRREDPLPQRKGKKRIDRNKRTTSARSGAKMAESDRGLWARNGETKRGKVSVGRAKISWTIDAALEDVRGELRREERGRRVAVA